MCVFFKAWCKMHGETNNDADGTSASTTGKRSPPGDCGRRRSAWSRGRQDVLRMHKRWFQNKQRGESRNRDQNRNQNRNQGWLTTKVHRRRRRRCRRRPDIDDQRKQQHRKDTVGGTRERRPKRHYLKDKDSSMTGQKWPNGQDIRKSGRNGWKPVGIAGQWLEQPNKAGEADMSPGRRTGRKPKRHNQIAMSGDQ